MGDGEGVKGVQPTKYLTTLFKLKWYFTEFPIFQFHGSFLLLLKLRNYNFQRDGEKGLGSKLFQGMGPNAYSFRNQKQL